MHHCLHVEEILIQILQSAAEGVLGLGDVARVARCCRSFYEPAMDIIWHTIPGLSPLLKCLPDELWYETPVDGTSRGPHSSLAFCREPTVAEWDALSRYAQRIKACVLRAPRWLEERPHYSVSPDVFRAIASYCSQKGWNRSSSSAATDPRRSLLFNLNELLLEFGTIQDTRAFAAYAFIVSPNLSKLVVLLPQSVPLGPGASPQTLAEMTELGCKTFSMRCRRLRSATITAGDLSTEGLAKALSHLAVLPTLEEFITNIPLVPKSLELLAKSPLLTRGQFMVPIKLSSSWSYPVPAARSGFSALRSLTIFSEDIDMGGRMLDSVQTENLKEIGFTCPESPESAVFVDSVFQFAKSQPGLRSFSFSLTWMRGGGWTGAQGVIPNSTLTSILSLAHLVSVRIDTSTVIEMDDDTVNAMAKSWPCLQILYILPNVARMKESKVTLEILLTFAENCPHLIHLSLPFSVFPPSAQARERALQIPIRNSLHLLQIIYGWPIGIDIGSFVQTYKFLINVFPKLTNIDMVCGRHLKEAEKGWLNFRSYLHPLLSARLKQSEILCPYRDMSIDSDEESERCARSAHWLRQPFYRPRKQRRNSFD